MTKFVLNDRFEDIKHFLKRAIISDQMKSGYAFLLAVLHSELIRNSFKIKSLLHKLALNRAAGKDGIFAEHISYADSSVCNHLSNLFNVCLMHGKIPQECMQTVIVPICKNKNGNISDPGNCFPCNYHLQVVWTLILSCISPLLVTTDNRFGFKPKRGTDMCIFLLIQTVSYYVNKDTPVFSAFLDASKALTELITTCCLLN